MNKNTYVNKSVSDEPGVSGPALGESAIGVEQLANMNVDEAFYDARLEQAVKKLWIDLMEFSKRHEVEISYWGVSLDLWHNGARILKIIARMLNDGLWEELTELIEKNGLRVTHWFMEDKRGEIRLYIWLHLDLGKEVSVE